MHASHPPRPTTPASTWTASCPTGCRCCPTGSARSIARVYARALRPGRHRMAGDGGARPLPRTCRPARWPQRTAMDKVAVSRAVARLLEAGRLTRSFDDDDRRRSVLRLSEAGYEIYDEVAPLALGFERQLLATCAADERAPAGPPAGPAGRTGTARRSHRPGQRAAEFRRANERGGPRPPFSHRHPRRASARAARLTSRRASASGSAARSGTAARPAITSAQKPKV